MKSKNLLFTIGGIFSVLALFLLSGCGGKDPLEESPGGLVPAPSFSLNGLNGGKIRLEDFRGKVVVLDFWATWCPPCREGIPELNRLYAEYRNRGLAVIGISLDRGEAEEVRRFLAQRGAEYLNALGNEEILQAYSAIPGLGKIQGIPTAFVIDREGRLRKKFVGLTSMRAFEAAIKPLL
jgi:peroxiredoxin